MQTLKATLEGLERIRQARETLSAQNGWAVDNEQWLKEASPFLPLNRVGQRTAPGIVSIGTWKRFLSGTAIKASSFRAFCMVLSLNWEEVVGISTLKVVINKRQSQNQFFAEELTENLSLRMMQIPAGTFIMGSPPNNLKRSNSEEPQHQVQVETFFLGKYLVTQAQWRFVAGLSQSARPLEPDPSQFKGDRRPVEQVSWHDATEFCTRLAQHTGRSYRLPTEAEWEYACRAGTTTPFHFGETIATELANYRGTEVYDQGAKGEYREETTPVDHFGIANAFGLCDMHGNVWEWCQDHWHENYKGAPVDGSAWLYSGAEENAGRIFRGGSWNCKPRDCRSDSRASNGAGIRIIISVGFRVVCRLAG